MTLPNEVRRVTVDNREYIAVHEVPSTDGGYNCAGCVFIGARGSCMRPIEAGISCGQGRHHKTNPSVIWIREEGHETYLVKYVEARLG